MEAALSALADEPVAELAVLEWVRWVRHYNEQRAHSALGNRPIQRVREVIGLDTYTATRPPSAGRIAP